MGSITEGFASAFRDFTSEGVSASGPHEPEKDAIRALGPLIENAVVQGRAPYSTWAELAAVTGASGDGAEVIVTAAGTTHEEILTVNRALEPSAFFRLARP